MASCDPSPPVVSAASTGDKVGLRLTMVASGGASLGCKLRSAGVTITEGVAGMDCTAAGVSAVLSGVICDATRDWSRYNESINRNGFLREQHAR